MAKDNPENLEIVDGIHLKVSQISLLPAWRVYVFRPSAASMEFGKG